MELIRTDRRTGEPVYSCTGVAVRGGGCFVAALETSLRSADHLLSAAGTVLPRYAAQVELARSLAAKLDELAANAWLNAAGKPDTSTAGQYQRALDALRLSPSSEKGRAAAPRAPRQASPLSRFTARKQDLEAVG